MSRHPHHRLACTALAAAALVATAAPAWASIDGARYDRNCDVQVAHSGADRSPFCRNDVDFPGFLPNHNETLVRDADRTNRIERSEP